MDALEGMVANQHVDDIEDIGKDGSMDETRAAKTLVVAKVRRFHFRNVSKRFPPLTINTVLQSVKFRRDRRKKNEDNYDADEIALKEAVIPGTQAVWVRLCSFVFPLKCRNAIHPNTNYCTFIYIPYTGQDFVSLFELLVSISPRITVSLYRPRSS